MDRHFEYGQPVFVQVFDRQLYNQWRTFQSFALCLLPHCDNYLFAVFLIFSVHFMKKVSLSHSSLSEISQTADAIAEFYPSAEGCGLVCLHKPDSLSFFSISDLLLM